MHDFESFVCREIDSSSRNCNQEMHYLFFIPKEGGASFTWSFLPTSGPLVRTGISHVGEPRRRAKWKEANHGKTPTTFGEQRAVSKSKLYLALAFSSRPPSSKLVQTRQAPRYVFAALSNFLAEFSLSRRKPTSVSLFLSLPGTLYQSLVSCIRHLLAWLRYPAPGYKSTVEHSFHWGCSAKSGTWSTGPVQGCWIHNLLSFCVMRLNMSLGEVPLFLPLWITLSVFILFYYLCLLCSSIFFFFLKTLVCSSFSLVFKKINSKEIQMRHAVWYQPKIRID